MHGIDPALIDLRLVSQDTTWRGVSQVIVPETSNPGNTPFGAGFRWRGLLASNLAPTVALTATGSSLKRPDSS
jgi:hypothetical protein